MSDFLDAGRLEDHPFPALAGAIFREGRSGELSLESDGRRRSVWFLGGNPVAVLSGDPQDHLAQILLDHGRINADEAQRLAALPETRDGLGSVDFLQKDTLNWGVKFRFVNLCYDLFRWEDGDYAFREGNPPKELFLLKVPAHSLIFKGVGYLGQGTLLDVVPEDAVFGPGPVPAAEARYLGPDERRLLEACSPGRTVADALGEAGENTDQIRRSIYALSCLGLISLERPQAGQLPAREAADASAFFLEEPATGGPPPLPAPSMPAAGEFSLGGLESHGETGFTLPPLDLPCEPGASGISPADFIAGEAGSPGSPFNEEFRSDGGDPFAGTLPSGAGGAGPAVAGGARPAARGKGAGAGRGFHLPRLAGIVLGALGAAAVVGAAGWWWISGDQTPPSIKLPAKNPPQTPPPPAAPDPSSSAAPAPAAPAPVAPAAPPPVPAAPPPAAPAVPPPAAAPAAADRADAPADRYRNGLEAFRSGDLDRAAAIWEPLLTASHRDKFTLLLMTACQHETIREAERVFASRELYLVGKKVNGRNCFRVCLETFASREAAARALAGLPAGYRSAGAAVRPVSDVLSR